MKKMLALILTLMLFSMMNSSARSTELDCFGLLGIYMKCFDSGPPAVGAGSWCKKWNRQRREALTFTDRQLATLERPQREAFKSIKRDIRRECIDRPERTNGK